MCQNYCEMDVILSQIQNRRFDQPQFDNEAIFRVQFYNMVQQTAFFAYPSGHDDLANTIENASSAISSMAGGFKVTTWPQMPSFGASIPETVRESITATNTFICDITIPNMNVYYETGYAIGLGKPIAPLLNTSFAQAESEIQKDGLFNTIGYKGYQNSDELQNEIRNVNDKNLYELYSQSINLEQPIFLLDTLIKTDFRNAIVSAIKNSGVNFRSFDPVEMPYFQTTTMISDASSASGIIIPILENHIEDAERHNYRAAYLAGFCRGMGRSALLLRASSSPTKQPVDYGNTIQSFSHPKDISTTVIEFSKKAIIDAQKIPKTLQNSKKSDLQKLTLGATAAENEFRTLENYFVETSEFLKALRGDVTILTGRKGAGKSAIFFQVRDRLRGNRKATVIDLKPESHHLSLFRKELLQITDLGLYDHIFAAFWHFLILTEILITIRKKLDKQAKYDEKALDGSKEIDLIFAGIDFVETGDFTTRINNLSRHLLREITKSEKNGEKINPQILTNIIYRKEIPKITDTIVKLTEKSSPIVLLFDNIDKGWPVDGLQEFDARLVRMLLEALIKVKNDLSVSDRNFRHLVFLRHDVFELLINHTPDKGKHAHLSIDWSDKAKLRQVIYKRLQSSSKDTHLSFEHLWQKYFPKTVRSKPSFEYFIEHSLMRPRFLISLIENAIANAINRGHTIIDADDCISAARQHSFLLINDFGYEIRDVSSISSDILHSLVGLGDLLTKQEILDRLIRYDVQEKDLSKIFDLMLWYGVFGLALEDSLTKYIYDYEYNFKRLMAEIKLSDEEMLYSINPAFQLALAKDS